MPEQGLRDKLRGLLRGMNGGHPIDGEESLVRAAATIIDRRASQEDMIDAILTAMSDEAPAPVRPSKIVVQDTDDFDQILDAIASSYGEAQVRTSGIRGDLDVGRKGDKYDEGGRNYRGKDRSGDHGKERVEMRDGAHDDIPYHTDATEVPGLPRTRHESLRRPNK